MLYLLHQFLVAAAAPLPPGADTCGAVICTSNTGIPSGNGDLGLAIGKIMKAVFSLMGSAAVIVVIIGGLQYVLSAGDPKRTARAKETILYSVIGIVISLSAYAIVTFITAGLSK